MHLLDWKSIPDESISGCSWSGMQNHFCETVTVSPPRQGAAIQAQRACFSGREAERETKMADIGALWLLCTGIKKRCLLRNGILDPSLIPSSPKTGCELPQGSPSHLPPYTSEVEARSRRAPTRFANPTESRDTRATVTSGTQGKHTCTFWLPISAIF